VRTFKRLFPVFLVSILLAGVALARPAGLIRPSNSKSVAVSKPFRPGGDDLRLYFGTVVRDTADDQGFEPARWQAPPQVPVWNSFFIWVSFLIQR